jgi:peptidyl-prolyl cis-trans isomerase C
MVLIGSAAPRAALAAAAAPSAPTPATPQPAAASDHAASSTQGPVVAQVGPVQVHMEQLQRVLIEGYGLNVLLNLVQLQVAKEQALRSGVKVTPQDVQKEREQTIERMFHDSNEKQIDKINAARDKGDTATADALAAQLKKDNLQALDQVLQNQHLSRAEFDIVTETNAYLKKIAEPMLVGKISDDNLKEAFNTLYGATIKCRHIQCANMHEIAEAQRRLKAGEPFAKVAEEMSRNPSTRSLGGELPPFNLQTQGLPEAFKATAWALQKEGDISDPVMAEGGFHLIQLEKRIPPKAVKFEDVKESLRADLTDRALQAAMKQLRQQITAQAVGNRKINDPVLQAQWQRKLDSRDAAIKDRAAMRRQMDLEREQAATRPAADLAPKTLIPGATTTTTTTTTTTAPGAAAAPSATTAPPATAAPAAR